MSSLLEILMKEKNPNKLISILGLYGIGKSTLARNMLHFVASRKYFTGGIVYVQLKNTRNVMTVL